MIKGIETVHEKGVADVNEDEIVVDREHAVFAVIDGTTGLGGLSGKMAAEIIKTEIETHPLNPLKENVLNGNRHLGQRMLNTFGVEQLSQIEKDKLSACGMAAIKLDFINQRFDYVHVADCMIFLQFIDGSVRLLTYDGITPFDSVSIKTFHEAMMAEIPDGENPNNWAEYSINALIKKAKQNTVTVLKGNRSKLNTLGGYGVLDGTSEAERFIEFGSGSLNRVKHILLISDGLQLPSGKSDVTDGWLETATLAFTHGLEALKREVDRMEKGDPACFDYPRLKPADDKTGILLTLE